METRNGPETAVERARVSTATDPCPHNGLAMIHRVVGGYVARCLACHTIGPILDTSGEARAALLEPETPHRARPPHP